MENSIGLKMVNGVTTTSIFDYTHSDLREITQSRNNVCLSCILSNIAPLPIEGFFFKLFYTYGANMSSFVPSRGGARTLRVKKNYRRPVDL